VGRLSRLYLRGGRCTLPGLQSINARRTAAATERLRT
jgi:hypothetical protein